MLAGGRYNMYAATALGVIRETGSKLPVEVWMNDTADEKDGFCDELAKDGMVCKWLSDVVDTRFIHNGYQLKIMTMIFSSFQEFLFLDADNQPIKNPDTIFDTKSFKDHGAILWPDYWDHTGSPLLPHVVGLAKGKSDMWRGKRTVESGQIVWDKKRHWKVCICLMRGLCKRERSLSNFGTVVTMLGSLLQLLWTSILLYLDNSRLCWIR